jgi:hypothetical protein
MRAPPTTYLQRATGWLPSNVFFCESETTDRSGDPPLVAELVNTLSSLPLVASGAFALHLALKERYGKRFVLCALAMLLTGVGSVAFHASLLFAAQLLDELSLVACACAFLAAIAVEPERGAAGKQRRGVQRCRNGWRRVIVPLAAILYMLGFGVTYATAARKTYSFFVATFAGLVALCLWRARRNLLAVADASGALLRMLATVVATTLVAFVLVWLPDRVLCAQLWPLHLHAAWHLLGVIPPLWLMAALAAELHARRVRHHLGLVVNLATGATAPAPPPAALASRKSDSDPEDVEALAAEDAAEAAEAGPLRAPRLEWLGCGCLRVPVVRLVRVAGSAR